MVIVKPGLYKFRLGSDDGSVLYLDGAPRLDNGGSHAYREREATLYLHAGTFAFRLDYFDIMADALLRLKVQYWPLPGTTQ